MSKYIKHQNIAYYIMCSSIHVSHRLSQSQKQQKMKSNDDRCGPMYSVGPPNVARSTRSLPQYSGLEPSDLTSPND